MAVELNILIVYATTYGATRKMAEAVAEGARVVAPRVVLKEAELVTEADMLSAHAIVVGTPVHMGNADWRVKRFIDEVCAPLWMRDALAGRVGAVFATGGGLGGGGAGVELALVALLNNLAELGLLLVPLPRQTPGYEEAGIQWGPYGRSHAPDGSPDGLNDEQLVAARNHGRNVAHVAALTAGKIHFAK